MVLPNQPKLNQWIPSFREDVSGASGAGTGRRRADYEQLWNYAGKITARLHETLDASEGVVALLASRSVGAYGGILGILGSGAATVR